MVEEHVMRLRNPVVVVLGGALVLLPAGSAQEGDDQRRREHKRRRPGITARAAIAAAVPGENIIVPAGTYTLTSDQLTITKSLTISGHARLGTTAPGPGRRVFRVFDVNRSGINVTIDGGITIRGGRGQRAPAGSLTEAEF